MRDRPSGLSEILEKQIRRKIFYAFLVKRPFIKSGTMSSFGSDDETGNAGDGEQSQIETPSFVAEEKSQLQDQVAHLIKENADLRAQFEEAINISKGVEEVHRKNRKLLEENGKLKSEKDNLEQRLEISLKANKQLSDQLEEERELGKTKPMIDYAALHREVMQEKERAKAEVEAVAVQIQEMKDQKEQDMLQWKLLTNKVGNLLVGAEHYFGQKFDSLDGLIEHFRKSERPVVVSDVAKPEEKVKTLNDDLNSKKRKKAEAKAKKLQIELKALKTENASLSEKAKASVREMEKVEKTLKRQVAILEEKCREQEQEKAVAEAESKRRVSTLEQKVQQLNTELAKRREVPVRPAEEVKVREPEVPEVSQVKVTKKTEEMDLAMNELLERNEELKRQIEEVSEKRDEYREKLLKRENDNIDLTSELNKKQNELRTLKIVQQETLAELATFRAIVHEKESLKEIDEKQMLKKELYSQKAQVKTQQHTIEVQKKQLHELALGREETAHKIEKKTKKVQELKNRAAQDEKTIETLKSELIELRREFDSKPVLTPEDVMPSTVWTYPGFPAELNVLIGGVIGDSAAPATKLHIIYRIVNQYFTDALNSRNSALDQAFSENQQIRDAVHQFVSSISIALDMDPVTFDTFFASGTSDAMIKNVSEMKNDLMIARKKSQELDFIMKQIRDHFGVQQSESTEIVAKKIGDVKRQSESQAQSLAKETKKSKELSKRLKALKKKESEHKVEYERNIDKLTTKLEDVKQDLEAARRENKKLKGNIDSLQTECRGYRTKIESAALEPVYNGPSPEMLENERQRDIRERSLQQQLACQKQNAEQFKEALDEANAVIERLKQTIQAQKSTISEKDNAIAGLRREASDTEKLVTKRASDEKQQLVDAYEKTVDELRGQCKSQQNEIQKLSQEAAAANMKLKQDRSTITQLKKANAKTEKEMQALHEQTEREKQLLEASARSALSKAQSDCASQLSDEKAKHEAEKRRLFAFVADAFQQFYNPQDVIDERSFRTVINQVKDALTSLSASNNAVRRLVGASQAQKTEDVVERALQGV